MPIALLKDPSVAAESKVLAGLLIAYDGPKGCFPKISSLMTDLGSSKHTIIRSLEELERYGFLRREKRGRNNTYHLTPAYVPPARPDDITLTGTLAVENAPRRKPVKRKTLHNRRPEPALPLALEQVAPVLPISLSRGKRGPQRVAPVQPISAGADDATGCMGATYPGESSAPLVAPVQPGLVASVQPNLADRLHPCNLDMTKNHVLNKNQQQQEAAADEKTTKADAELLLINAAVAPEDAVRWASDLIGLNPADVRDALRIMRAKPAYRRREIARPGAYLRTLCTTAVVTERELAEHEARASRRAEIRRADSPSDEDTNGRTGATGGNLQSMGSADRQHDSARPEPEVAPSDVGPPIHALVDNLAPDQRDAVTARARHIVRGGPESPAWPAALSIAMRGLGYLQ